MAFVESDTVELKSRINNDICKEIIAFANTKGGVLYLGVNDGGEVVGLNNVDQEMLRVNNMVRDSIRPDVTVFVNYETLDAGDKQILKITVQKGINRPYYLAGKGLRSGGVFVRNGSSSDPASDVAIRKMIKESDGDRYEDRNASIQNLTFEHLKTVFMKKQLALDVAKMKNLGLIDDEGRYTNVALLVSDQCDSTIKAATFSGKDKGVFRDRREFAGSLFSQIDDLYSYLDLRNQTMSTFSGLYRTDVRDYPEEALREAILNCVVHRDYSYGASALVSVFDDRIEIVSIGGLLTGIGLDDIMAGVSVCRNPKLANIFYRLELIEAYGTGMRKIMDAYRSSVIKPRVEVTSNAFKVTLPNRNIDNAVDYVSDVKNRYELKIIEYLKTHTLAARCDIDALLKVSQSTSSRIIRTMIDAGLIEATGRGKASRYKIRRK